MCLPAHDMRPTKWYPFFAFMHCGCTNVYTRVSSTKQLSPQRHQAASVLESEIDYLFVERRGKHLNLCRKHKKFSLGVSLVLICTGYQRTEQFILATKKFTGCFDVKTASAQGGIASCCLKIYSTNVARNLLQSYYIQHRPPCPLQAVVFITIRGKRICSDPNSLWTNRSMGFLDGKNWHDKHIPSHQHHQ
uniref:Chemokine interleukin-8-like domain-containing protein n=1 Tax=Scophthalmus maximus TaxID=52904 RepID=A0A8D2ZRG1_SCOMX